LTRVGGTRADREKLNERERSGRPPVPNTEQKGAPRSERYPFSKSDSLAMLLAMRRASYFVSN
jgi:hypothetical protein